MKVAILFDGGFFIKRYKYFFKNSNDHTPEQIANNLHNYAFKHLKKGDELYRIFFYDCRPLTKKVHSLITGKSIDFSKSEVAIQRNELFEQLKKKRSVALRLGYLKDTGHWAIKPSLTKDLIKGRKSINDIQDQDLYYELRQKGIDMKIGVDIASITLKKFVNKIILISGDADFVPSAKLARREGVDFVLDAMHNHIDPSLFEHIDGLTSPIKPISKTRQ